jgi:hypothetical protein
LTSSAISPNISCSRASTWSTMHRCVDMNVIRNRHTCLGPSEWRGVHPNGK